MSEAERRTVRVAVFDHTELSDADWPSPEPHRLIEVMRWFQEKLAKIPEQYRDRAECSMEAEHGDYDEDGPTRFRIEVWYDRPETDEEYDRRTAEAARIRERVREIHARTANTRDRRGEAQEIVRGLGPGLEAMRKNGLTE